jgi:uncharacterized protein YjiS (DUF1127 family)
MATIMKKFSISLFLQRRRTYRSVLRELSSYSDHELGDMGIDRVDIHKIARSAAQEQEQEQQ